MNQRRTILGRLHISLLAATLFLLTAPVVSLGQEIPDLRGSWQGTLLANQFDPLDLVFHIQGEADTLTATLDIPAHSRFGIAADSVSIRNGNLMIRLNNLQAEYYGSIKISDNAVIGIDGDWNQSGEHIPLALTPAAAQTN